MTREEALDSLAATLADAMYSRGKEWQESKAHYRLALSALNAPPAEATGIDGSGGIPSVSAPYADAVGYGGTAAATDPPAAPGCACGNRADDGKWHTENACGMNARGAERDKAQRAAAGEPDYEAALRLIVEGNDCNCPGERCDGSCAWSIAWQALNAPVDAALAAPAGVCVAEGTVSKRISGDDAIVCDKDQYGEERGTLYVDANERLTHGQRVRVLVVPVKP